MLLLPRSRLITGCRRGSHSHTLVQRLPKRTPLYRNRMERITPIPVLQFCIFIFEWCRCNFPSESSSGFRSNRHLKQYRFGHGLNVIEQNEANFILSFRDLIKLDDSLLLLCIKAWRLRKFCPHCNLDFAGNSQNRTGRGGQSGLPPTVFSFKANISRALTMRHCTGTIMRNCATKNRAALSQ